MTSAPDTAMRDALIDRLLALDLFPSCHLPAGAVSGAGAVTVDDASRLMIGGVIDWMDGSAEFPIVIETVAGTTVTLDFTGRGITGLQYAHGNGATCGTCVLRVQPNPLDDSLVAAMSAPTQPVWYVFAPAGTYEWTDIGAMQAVPISVVLVQVFAVPPETAIGALQADLQRQVMQDTASANAAALLGDLRETTLTVTIGDESNAPHVRAFRSGGQMTAWGANAQTPVWEHTLEIDFDEVFVPS